MPTLLLPRAIWTPPATITPWSHESVGPMFINFAAPSSAVYPTANKAFYIPFAIPDNMLVVKLFCLNGTATGNNLDLGIYNALGTRLVSSGSTAQAGTSVVQAVDITDIVLSGPGLYYMAVAFDGTTSTLFRTATSQPGTAAWGVLEQTSAFALPTTATFATPTGNYLPMIGVSMRALIA